MLAAGVRAMARRKFQIIKMFAGLGIVALTGCTGIGYVYTDPDPSYPGPYETSYDSTYVSISTSEPTTTSITGVTTTGETITSGFTVTQSTASEVTSESSSEPLPTTGLMTDSEGVD